MIREKILLPGLLLFLIFSACAPTKEAAYLSTFNNETINNKADQVYLIEDTLDNRIRPGDELYINVTSSDEGPTNFNRVTGERINDPELISYNVDEEGMIKMPYIGKVKVSDMTLKEAGDFLEKSLAQFLFYPSVSVKFINNKVAILGEVRRPGVYVFNYKTINLYQAIAYANDISEFGNRRRVLLVRREGDEISKKYLDLTKDEVLTSEWFQIKSNDVIYVEPLGRKKWGIETFPYNLLLSFISTTILIVTFVGNKQ